MPVLGPSAALYFAVGMAWCVDGAVEASRSNLLDLVAWACRYGHAGSWAWEVDSELLSDFANSVMKIVEKENRPRG